MRILVAIEPVDFRCGIDGLAQICKQRLQEDPFRGCLLPAPRVVSQYSANQRLKPAVVETDSRPIAGTLGSLGPLRFEQVRRTAQEPLFHGLIEEHLKQVRLKKFIFGSGREKTEAIMASLGQDGKAPSSEGKPGGENASGEGEGTRDGTAGETAGETEQEAKPQAGDGCPLCGQGPVYQWLFFKHENGAHVGDVYLSLIQTCELNGFNPGDYFHAPVRHRQAVAANPTAWMPWNYPQTVASLSNPEPPPAAAVRQAS